MGLPLSSRLHKGVLVVLQLMHCIWPRVEPGGRPSGEMVIPPLKLGIGSGLSITIGLVASEAGMIIGSDDSSSLIIIAFCCWTDDGDVGIVLVVI